jgi:hypothetical protein
MPSPFPGMNPYLEQADVWHDFHERFIPVMAELLEAQVGPNYIVKIDERIYVHDLPPADHRWLGRADVLVGRTADQSPERSGSAILEAPVTVQLPRFDVESLSVLEIRDRRDREIVCTIEVLSPTNKRPSPHREQYLAKRAQILASSCHFVEIDLLRGGPRMPLGDLPPCDYYALVSRAEDRPRSGLWPLRIRDALPVLPVPLRAPDGEVVLDLKKALDRVYDAAGYEKYVYAEEPSPELSPEDAEWARGIVARARGG